MGERRTCNGRFRRELSSSAVDSNTDTQDSTDSTTSPDHEKAVKTCRFDKRSIPNIRVNFDIRELEETEPQGPTFCLGL